jgi:uncharacterized Fe-S radical SAM superfamily protein PflX
LRRMMKAVRALLLRLEEELEAELEEEEVTENKVGIDHKKEEEEDASDKKEAELKLLTTKVKSPTKKKGECVLTTRTAQVTARGGVVPGQVQVGARVVVKARDQYYGQYGTLIGKRGNYFWDIKLDAMAENLCV